MTHQPDLFLPMCVRTRAVQGRLFDDLGPADWKDDDETTCSHCGEPRGWCEEWQQWFTCPCRAGI